MPDNSANNTPAQDKCAWHRLSTCQKCGVVVAIAAGLFVIIALVAAYVWRGEFAMAIGYRAAMNEITPGAQFFRDFVALCAVIVGIVMAAWRNASLDKQSKAVNKQAETAAKQLALTEKRMIDDQFANAMESMRKENKDGIPLIDDRIGGINDMAKLAIKYPGEFAERAVNYLIEYIKNNAQLTATPPLGKDAKPTKLRKLGRDVKAAFSVLRDILVDKEIKKDIDKEILDFSQQNFSYLDISGARVSLHHYNEWTRANFQGANLCGASFSENTTMYEANFTKANMSGVMFHGRANLARATMVETDLSDAVMMQIDLSDADLRGADLSGSFMHGTNFKGAKMHGVNAQHTLFDTRRDGDMTDLSYAHLHGANLASAELEWVNMEKTSLWGVNFYDAALSDILPDADFWGTYIVNVGIGKLREDVKSAMNRKVIHEGDEELAAEVEECPNDFNWRLEEYPDSYALNGVLNNFIKEGANMRGGLALRKQAWKLRHDERMSPKWREWLEQIDPHTGKHPDDDMPS